jgi:hypothetical protein
LKAKNSQHKNPIKDQWPEPSRGDKKGRPKDVQLAGIKKRERANPSHSKKLSHSQPL